MGEEITAQVQEVQRVLHRVNLRINMPRHILIQLTKIKYKEEILKATNNIQENPHKANS